MSKRLTRNFFTRPTLMVAKQLLGKYLIRCYGQRKIIGMIVETEAYIGPKDKASHAYSLRRNFQKDPKKIIEKIFNKEAFQNKVFLENFLRGKGKKTKRNLAEYLIGGHIYIYLVYGMYWQLNITTGLAGQPECVLIRALEPVINKNSKSEILNPKQIQNSKFKIQNLTNGPGKLCRYLKLNKSFYGEDLTRSQKIWLAASIQLRRASPASPSESEAWPKRRENGEKVYPSQIVASPRIGIDYAGQYWAKKKWRFYLKDNPFVSKYR